MSSKHVVLYADDDPDDLELVVDAFQQYSRNVQLETVEDGFELLSYLKNLPPTHPAPCLVILDLNMPRLNGKETIIELRKLDRFKTVPTILFTTSTQPRDMEFARQYNAGFITKPIDTDQLDVIVTKFIQHCSDGIQKNINKPKA